LGLSRPAAAGRCELLMLIWCAHSIAEAQRLDLKFDREYVKSMISHCADHGITSILWRGSYVGKSTYPTKVGEMMGHLDGGEGFNGKAGKETLETFNRMADTIAGFDTLEAGLLESKKRGIRFYADLALFDRYFPGLENRFFDQHPHFWAMARDQKTYYRGIPCYAQPGAQDYVLREVDELLARGVDGVSISLESHAGALASFGAAGKGPDEYSFNPSIVTAYKQRHGVNILRQDLNPSKLYALNGNLFTQFLRRIRQALGSRRKFICATLIDGYVGYGGRGGEQLGDRTWIRPQPIDVMPAYRIDLEWRKWINEGIADALMVYAPMSDAVGQVQRLIKSKLKTGPVFLLRETDNKKFEQEYRSEFSAVRGGGLDGIVIDEMKDYHPLPQYWCKLLE
jgi:hypothetical protein